MGLSRAIQFFVSFLILGVLVGLAVMQASFSTLTDRLLLPESEMLTQLELPSDDSREANVWNVLLVGNDQRKFQPGGGQRSDSVWMLRLDAKRQVVNVFALPRDWQVVDPATGSVGKLTDVYGRGGVKALLKVIKRETGVPMDGVVMLRFEAFSRLVNRMGCLYVDVDRRYFNKNVGTVETNYADIDLQPGYQRLCGLDSLSYARHRHSDNDLYRSRRQLVLLKAAQLQWSKKALTSLDNALGVLPYVDTTIRSKDQIKDIAYTVMDLKGVSVRHIKWKGDIVGANVVTTSGQMKAMVDDYFSKDKPIVKYDISVESSKTRDGVKLYGYTLDWGKELVGVLSSALMFDSSNGRNDNTSKGKSENNDRSNGKGRKSSQRKLLTGSVAFEDMILQVPSGVESVVKRKYSFVDWNDNTRQAVRITLNRYDKQAYGIQWVKSKKVLWSEKGLVKKRMCNGWVWVVDSLDSKLLKVEEEGLLKQVRCSWFT